MTSHWLTDYCNVVWAGRMAVKKCWMLICDFKFINFSVWCEMCVWLGDSWIVKLKIIDSKEKILFNSLHFVAFERKVVVVVVFEFKKNWKLLAIRYVNLHYITYSFILHLLIEFSKTEKYSPFLLHFGFRSVSFHFLFFTILATFHAHEYAIF